MSDFTADALENKKSHRERHAGRKAEKKKSKKNVDPSGQELTDKQRNPKAFAFNSAIRAERRFRRKQDIDTKKQHIPLVDRTPIEPPPILIVVVGPPKVGKSTVINNLIKLFTKAPLTDVKGPVTIVTGKKRRITLIECNNDVNSMIDLAKVADLVLLLCDASFGFEMEVFEFLNICQVHGMPRIMGVLTHLDMIKNSKTLKNTKKTLKHRFWTEVYPGAKLFYLSGILHGEYLRNEIKNLGRFISIIKLRPLTWRTTHSYMLVDRYEDLTNQDLVRKNPNCDRNVSLYGYVRGVPLSSNTSVHIAGVGDFKINDISFLPDPCALPEAIKKRALIEKERLIYAPFSGVGGIVYDKDAVYVELGGSHSHKPRDNDDESNNIVTNLIGTKETLNFKLENSEMQLFTGGTKLVAKDVESNLNLPESTQLFSKGEKEVEELDEELNKLRKKPLTEEKVEDSGRIRRKVVFEQNDEDFSTTCVDEEESDDDESDDEVPKDQPEYLTLKDNKDSEVHVKVSEVLKKLDRKEATVNSMHDSDDSGDSDDDDELPNDEDELSNDEDDSSKTEDRDAKKSKSSEKLQDESSDESYDEMEDNVELSDESAQDIDNVTVSSVKWKENLAEKARDAFIDRQSTTQNLMKLVYGVFDNKYLNQTEEETQSEQQKETNNDEIGGLFRVVSREQQRLKLEKDSMNLTESSLITPWNAPVKDWLNPENKVLIENCFVTGKWKDSEDAAELLRLDDIDDRSDGGSEMYGDFEDLETGEKHTAIAKGESKTEKRKADELEKDGTLDRQALAEKKRKLKEQFDSEYDNVEKSTFYDDLKTSAEKQSMLNKSVFVNMTDELRVQIEGYRPGMYVRIEFQNVPAELINNFDAMYPVVVGALNMGEENIGFVNVKIKKHRWYQRILKTNDALIISLGWRRFQTIPLFSKLEDDLKYRYLKYTPQHVTCNAHFWGPITPQGTGFLALQSCDSNPEIAKSQGFRIAATGSVQELDKSTRIMKKLKLIGYPLKIYKRTAFIKGMFNSTLEVAKFEGARIKTVSGIRGQIKKAARKPEGCFRGTFEDKIQLSDIVFCRTWYKVDVPKFYIPITTLLMPSDKRNAWQGVRTTGQIKREKQIRNQPEMDSLYREIVRDPKVFKPFVIPHKLQKRLPYRDKPKGGILISDKKKPIERVAVIREPHEQKVSTMLKMLRASYNQKQTQMKLATKERMEKHRKEIEMQEARKNKKSREQKKQVMRSKSKAQIKEQSKGVSKKR